MTTSAFSEHDEQRLLGSARQGDEAAFRDLVEAHRPELHGHCYRLLASVQDAEDAVQDALLRAWRGLSGFEGRSSVRTWLFKIATNTALDIAGRRARRELPVDFVPPRPVGRGPGDTFLETLWLEPYPDTLFGATGSVSPEARYELGESVELAFVAALQHIPATQRAVLILRDVLAFSAREVAEILDTTEAAVNSTLQRAHAAATRLPERSQQATLRSLGDEKIRRLATRYAEAIEKGDIETLLSLMTEDATWAMPPAAGWYRGPVAIGDFLQRAVFPERWRHATGRASGQLAVGCYLFDADRGLYTAAVLDVLTLEGDRIAQVTAFLTNATADVATDAGYRFVGSEVFPRFGLPIELPV
jgi:RNA polymerase sigma-70 factor (ECF subfamily)